MTFDKALQILGLNKNFTEEDLKRAHRNLAQVHHPDRHEKSEDREKEEDIMKDINAAKDYLMKYLKENKHQDTAYSNINIVEYRKTKIEELKRIVSLKFVADFASKLDDLSVNITTIFYRLEDLPRDFYHQTAGKKTKTFVDELYKEYLNKIKEKFKELETYFYQENYINKSDIKENINYDCTLKEFCDQLLKFKDKYSKEALLNKKLEEELLKYTYFAGYEIIETQIKDVIRNFTSKIKNQRFKYNQQDIDEVNKEITELFNKFFSLKKKIETLEKTIKPINNKEIQEQFELIKNNLYSGYSFDGFDDQISELEEKIEKYIQETVLKTKFKENEQTINEIYKELISRYSKVAQSFNIIVHPEIIDEINKQLNALIQLFQEGCKKFKDLDFFNLFNEITFKSIVDDDKITKKIRNELKEKSSKIYIKINIERIWDEYSFFWFDEENMIMYRINNLDYVYSEKISYEQIDKDYISLEEFLDEANFVGEQRMKSSGLSVGLVYERFGYSLYWEKDKFRINKDIALIKTSDRKNEYLNRFRDKKYVYDMIEEQLRESFEEYNKRESTSHGDYFNFIDIDNNGIIREKESYSDSSYGKIFGKPEYNYDDPYGFWVRKRK